jgi:hemerythrin
MKNPSYKITPAMSLQSFSTVLDDLYHIYLEEKYSDMITRDMIYIKKHLKEEEERIRKLNIYSIYQHRSPTEMLMAYEEKILNPERVKVATESLSREFLHNYHANYSNLDTFERSVAVTVKRWIQP